MNEVITVTAIVVTLAGMVHSHHQQKANPDSSSFSLHFEWKKDKK